jgi:hypothetical protein
MMEVCKMDRFANGMTQEQKDNVMQTMQSNMDLQNSPKVGIFWYDIKANELFGVTASLASDLPFNDKGLKTIGFLHRDWWKKQQMRAKAKNQSASIFLAEYTQIPRGRIFQTVGGQFQLMCGSWINEFPQVVDLVKEEFDLSELEVVIDEHWEIGHGWSE